MSSRHKIVFGATLGLIAAPFLVLASGVPATGLGFIAGACLVGSLFGATLAYSLDRLAAPVFPDLEWEEGPQGMGRVAASGAVAGGVAGSAAYPFGFLNSPWEVAACFLIGALFVACHWVYANLRWP